MKSIGPKFLLILTFFVLADPTGFSSAQMETAIPKLEGPVNDLAHVIPSTFARRMAAVSDALFQKTGVSIVTVTLPESGEHLDKNNFHSIHAQWAKEGKKKGILIFFADKEKRLRIETGQPLERLFPEDIMEEIQNRQILPYLKRGQVGEGLLAGTIAIARMVADDAGISLNSSIPLKPVEAKTGGNTFLPIILGIVLLFILSRRRRAP